MADEFSAQLNATLSQYDNEIREGVRKSVDKNTETLEKELKRDSPRRRGAKRKRGGKFSPGSYARGWRTSTAVNNFSTYEKVVYNSTHYPLTHLLEKGHAKRGGGRVAPRVHIAPAEERAEKSFEKDVEKLIKSTK